MSRSKEGVEKGQTEQTTEQTTPSRGRTLDEQLGARGQTDYTPGRESSREFPRRSTSLRGRTESYSESRDLYSPESQGGYGRQSGWAREGRRGFGTRYGESDLYATRGEIRERGYRSGEREPYDRGTRYGAYGRTWQREPERYSRYGEREYESRQRYGRARSGRTFDYDREPGGFESEREAYYEPQGRGTLSGRYRDYDRDYESSRLGYETDYDRDEIDYGYEGRRDWGRQEYGRNLLRCGEIMTKDVTVCSPQTPLREVADKMEDDDVGSIPVVENGRLRGIVTDRDIVCRILAEGRDTRTSTAADAMSEDLVTCTPDESVADAIRKMGENQVRRIPVCDVNGRLRGIIAMADVALEAERDRELADALEQISQPTPNQSRRR